MKRILIFSFIIFAFSYVSKAQSSSDRDAVEMKVDGLGCPFCSIGLVQKVKKLGDLKDIDTEYETGMFMFTIADKHEVTIEDLQNTVKKAGYTLVYANIARGSGEKIQFGERPEAGS
ncbi:MAG: hypothetical protein AAF388_22495 [Bacteroidota bacterium]